MRNYRTFIAIGILFIICIGTTAFTLRTSKLFVISKKNTSNTTTTSNPLSNMSWVHNMDNDTSLQFQTSFRSGHVTPGTLEDYLTPTDDGYIINLKNTTPVATPTIIDRTIYVSGGFSTKKFYSFDLITGKLNWAVNLDDDGPSPSVHNDSLIFFNTESCTLFALDRFTGTMKWSLWLGDPLMSTPALSDNRVYSAYPASGIKINNNANFINHSNTNKNTPSHAFACFEANTGKILWQKWLDGDVLVCPVIDDQFVYLTTFPGTLYKFDKVTGETIASVSMKATSPPNVTIGSIFVSKRADDGKKIMESIAELSKKDFTIIHEFNKVEAPYLDSKVQEQSDLKRKSMSYDANNGFGNGAPPSSGYEKAMANIGQSNVSSLQLFQPSTILTAEGRVYNLMGETLYCTDPKSEETVWKHKVEGDIKKEGGSLATTPIIAGHYMVSVSLNGELMIFDTNDGTLKFKKDTGKNVRSSPVVKKGIVLVPTTTGELIMINTGITDLDGWPMFMKNSAHMLN